MHEPDPRWPSAFELERDAVGLALAGLGSICIEHIGSTAVSGIRAKPIIDIMVGVETYDSLDAIQVRLAGLGYEYDENAVQEEPGRHVFRKGRGDPGHLRTHHLHLTVLHSAYWIRILAFRDYLRSNRAVAVEYERLKVELAERYSNDGHAYTREKSTFVRRVEAMAIPRAGPRPPSTP